ncbi:MAG: hypothetical protein ACR2OZ_11735 [Verrucomicrobiales bacterium]
MANIHGGLLLAAFVLTAFPSTKLRAAAVIVPGEAVLVEGDGNNTFPFNTISNTSSTRYQQVFGASSFPVVPGGLLITQMSFRPDGFYGAAFSQTLPQLELRLSTTSRAVDNLLSAFAGNVGPDERIVFSGALTLSSADAGPPNGPKVFDINIPFQVPFLYDPTRGSLLIEVRNFALVTTVTMDASTGNEDALSRVFTGEQGDVKSPTGQLDSIGLIAQLVWVPIPEPACLLQIAALGTAALWRRRRRNNDGTSVAAVHH